jgi:hypothetical protein
MLMVKKKVGCIKPYRSSTFQQGIKPLVHMVSIHGYHAPQGSAKGRGGGEHLIGGQTRCTQRCLGVLQDVLLRHHAPRDIDATPHQTDGVDAPTHEATA